MVLIIEFENKVIFARRRLLTVTFLLCSDDVRTVVQKHVFELLITFQLSRGQLDFAEVATLKKRSCLITVLLGIQARL